MNMMISIIIMGFEQAKSYQASSQANYVHVPFVYDHNHKIQDLVATLR